MVWKILLNSGILKCCQMVKKKRTKIGLVTNITAYYHVLVQIKKKQLEGYYFKEPSGRSKVQVMSNGKTSDNPEWLFGKFDQYLAELVGF